MYNGAIVADAHCDTVLRALDGHDLARGCESCHVDVPKLRRAGVDLQVFALWVGVSCMPYTALNRLSTLLAHVHSLIFSTGDAVALARNHSEFERNLAENKASIVLAVEGAHCLPPAETSIDFCHSLGVRLITLCWNNTNWMATSAAQSEVFPYGLTPVGRRAVKRMCKLGMIVDVSHASERAFWDVAETCDMPFVASHSCAKGVYDHSRNLDDKQLRAIAYANGTVGINFCRAFLKKGAEASIDDVVEHVEYIIGLIGDQHVSLGSDFDGIPAGPNGLESVEQVPRLMDRLLARGHSDATVLRIAGANLLRVFREVCG